MSSYTTELRHLISAGYELELNEYPIFDENYRQELNSKIIDFYYFREIGLETPDRFNHYIKTRMNQIMPYYNKLYKSQLLEFNPLTNYDYTETETRENESENTGSTSSEDENNVTFKQGKKTAVNVESDTPQGSVSPYDIDTGGYASRIVKGENTSEDDETLSAGNNVVNTTGNLTATEQVVKRLTGYQGVMPAELLKSYQQAIIRVDSLIINELADLFMQVY